MKIVKEARFMANSNASFPITMTFYAIIAFLLIISFSLLSSATDGNLSISGTKTLDINSNGIRDPSDPVLEGAIIFVDKNNDSRWQQNEFFLRTDRNGEYNFTNISMGTYVVRELLSPEQAKPSYPKSGFYYVDLSSLPSGSATGFDFGSTAGKSKDSDADEIYKGVLSLILIIIVIGGLWVLYQGLSRLDSLARNDHRADKKTMLMMVMIKLVSGFVLLLLGLYLLANLTQISSNVTNAEIIGLNSYFSIIIPVVLAVLVFGTVLLMCYAQFKLRDQEPGAMRKTIAGILVIGLMGVIFFALSGKIENRDIITQYIQLVGVIIAFYFGSRVAADATERIEASSAEKGNAEKDLNVKSVIYDSKNGEVQIKVANSKGRAFGVNKVIIKDGESILIDKPAVATGSMAFKAIGISLKLDDEEKKRLDNNLGASPAEKKYGVTIETTTIGDKLCECTIERLP